MNTIGLLTLALALVSCPIAVAQSNDERALESLGSEYALGFHLGEAERMLATVHRDLSKRGVRRVGSGGPEALTWLEGDLLRHMGDNYDYEDQFDESTQRIVRVYQISGDVAALELVAGDWYDAFTAIRTGEGWRILDCVWGVLSEYEQPERDAGEGAAIAALFETFTRAVAVGDTVALDRTMHAQAQVRGLADDGALEARTRAQAYAGLGAQEGAPRATMFNVTMRTAMGRVQHGDRAWWLQALRVGEEWKVVNAHWQDGAERR